MPDYVLAVHCGHDASAALARDGRIVAAIVEERLDRIKHSDATDPQGGGTGDGFPWLAVNYCLEAEGIRAQDLTAFTTNYDHRPTAFGGERIEYPGHHACHAATAYYWSGAERCAILVIDYAGDTVWLPEDHFVGYERESAWIGDADGIVPVWWRLGGNDATLFGIGCVYNQIAAYLFATQDAEGKLMALSALGRPNAELGDSFLVSDGHHVYARPSRLFRQAPRPKDFRQDVPYYECELDWDALPPSPAQTGEFTQFHFDLAFKLQREVEERVVFLAERLQRVTKAKTIALAGGVALNCLANGRIAARAGFDRVCVAAAPHDGGLSCGAALMAWRQLRGVAPPWIDGCCFGRVYREDEIETTLRAAAGDVKYTRSDHIARDAAARIARGEIVGWFQSASELGPRALGSRSILADARAPSVIDRLNREVKRRYPFQPIAPSVRAEDAATYFEGGPSPFMSFAPGARATARVAVPAVVHADGTSRIHTVECRANPLYHSLLTEFASLTGVPIVANTSFNRKGEPIVETPDDAVRDLLKMPLDALAIGPFIAIRTRHA